MFYICPDCLVGQRVKKPPEPGECPYCREFRENPKKASYWWLAKEAKKEKREQKDGLGIEL